MHTEKILKLQKRAARVITSSGLGERSCEIFQMFKWTKIQSTLKKRELVMTFKALRDRSLFMEGGGPIIRGGHRYK